MSSAPSSTRSTQYSPRLSFAHMAAAETWYRNISHQYYWYQSIPLPAGGHADTHRKISDSVGRYAQADSKQPDLGACIGSGRRTPALQSLEAEEHVTAVHVAHELRERLREEEEGTERERGEGC
eukprot:3936403-Rhodomonas_salina.1